MRKAVIIAVPCLFMLTAGFAFAQIWEKYTPSKEVWSIIRIKVEPNKINDYLDGLHKTYVPGIEIAKKNGTIVDYRILRNINSRTGDANIVIIEQYSNWEAVAPNKERDLKALAEFRAILSKDQDEKTGDEYNKYRKFVDEELYWGIEFVK